jgi:alpha-L-fucosidase
VAKLSKKAYLAEVEKTRTRRMKWWNDARFGMFIHWGLYSQPARHEWVMCIENTPLKEYETLAETWKPKPRPMREWAKLAKKAGMKYMVMTTKHHEGFLLWDSEQTDYNAAKTGPGRDLVREYVEACREFDLKVGFYYSLMDWHHPDGITCARSEKARRRFLDFTQGCVRELMTNYGTIDVLWYDVSWPLRSPAKWESVKMNTMVRELQPQILINNRSQLEEDFATPEERVQPAESGRGWEACMTFQRASWGYMPAAAHDAYTARDILKMLRVCCAGQGNLLLNIGPAPDGSVPEEAVEPLRTVGKWIRKHEDVVYGKVDRCAVGRANAMCQFSQKGKKLHVWVLHWPGSEIVFGGLKGKVKKATLLPNGKSLKVKQDKYRTVVSGLPKRCPDRLAEIAVLELEFASKPKHEFGMLYRPQNV